MDFELCVLIDSLGADSLNLLNDWSSLSKPVKTLKGLLCSNTQILIVDGVLEREGKGWGVVYDAACDGHAEEVLGLLKQYRPELYYEILLGIKK